MPTIERLRAEAIRNTLFAPTTLRQAIEKLGFVQADPIRAPARAQDLILRHRVREYRAGDLEQRYPKLEIEEDFLYAYGFLPRPVWRLLHPRNTSGLSKLEKRVLEIARSSGQLHPRQLAAQFGQTRTVNAWGGYSNETTRALQQLHYRGLLRVAGREKGIRLYEPAGIPEEHLTPAERLRHIVLLLAHIFAPVPLSSLKEVLRFLYHAAPLLPRYPRTVETLQRTGELESLEVDGLVYVRPADALKRRTVPDEVRFLAPFDPLVWDRRRLEHLWGWRYRFEAYTPVKKRQLGYYAMPVLWRSELVGWANVSNVRGALRVQLGFREREPDTSEFAKSLLEETERMRSFLGLDPATEQL